VIVVEIPQQASDGGWEQLGLDSAPPVAQDIERSRDVPELTSKLKTDEVIVPGLFDGDIYWTKF